MALARYKDLCIDANDVDLVGRFWASALGLAQRRVTGEEGALDGPTDRHRVWINRVPEPKAVKHRVHLDVHGASVEALVALGARVIDRDSFRWTVMADPEGGEFCLFERDPVPAYRLYEIAFDCVDHLAMSAWWASVLGAERGVGDEGYSWVEHIPGAPFDAISFGSVPEPKAAKNRVHIDVATTDVGALVAAGARLLRERDDEIGWTVLADPEGNEFCAFTVDDA